MIRHFHVMCVAAILLALLLGVAAPPLAAQEEQSQTAPTPSFLDEKESDNELPGLPNAGEALVRVALVMLLLFALLFGGLLLFRKVSRQGLMLGGESRPLRIVDRITLGPKSSVCLVQTCGKALVLGVSEKEISVLMDMDLGEQRERHADFAGELSELSTAPTQDRGPSPA